MTTTRRAYISLAGLAMLLIGAAGAWAAEKETHLHIDYPVYPPAPVGQSWEEADRKSAGCQTCHTDTDRKTMHASEAVVLGCTDCHGGDASVFWEGEPETPHMEHEHQTELAPINYSEEYGRLRYEHPTPVYSEEYQGYIDRAHVRPTLPDSWKYPSSTNPRDGYTLLNVESPEFVRFTNPADYRVVEEACGACHLPVIRAAKRSIMATGAMLWGGASYNNGILPYKRYILGEAYTREGEAMSIKNPVEVDEKMLARGILPQLFPLPRWHTVPPADVFRVFERGGRNIVNLFPETGLPSSVGQIQRLEEPGRPDIRQSNRGPATGNRVAIPVLNIHKTRLNDPLMWFMGTNDNPGDFRHSGCSSCHVVYANDRDPRHSGPYAKFGHKGLTQTADPTIPRDIPGHPLKHEFTRAIPTSQCMICHMHQPNMFMNTYLGYTMWDYESDAPHMWPEEQSFPPIAETRTILDRNPEEAVVHGKWRDLDFLEQVWEMNPELDDTQFADYHGHGWNFRAILKRDRKGNLLDAEGNIVANDDPEKWEKTVHMSSIHVDVGMHCVDCHFDQDSHGNGHIVGEVMAGIEIKCIDCHGTVDEYPTLLTSGPMAPPAGHDLSLKRNPDGKRRFEWINGKLIQRSLVNPGMEWEVSLLKDFVDPAHAEYNAKAARAKLVSNDTSSQDWGTHVEEADRAHKYDNMLCYTCHTSWTTSCGGCHLPIQANWKTETHHYEREKTRSFATYNPQVARDQMFQLGKHGEIKHGKIAPIASRSALVLSSTNANREKIYIQQPPISAAGFSSQAFAPHFPHTSRKTETKTCTDCHLSEENDNNAIMAQLLLLGNRFVDFMGYIAYVGTENQINGVQVTEWDEPQAVIGSYLHKYAYPKWFDEHQGRSQVLENGYKHRTGDAVNCLQHRGEYLFVAQGTKGTQVYDIASVANKGFSQRIITAPFGPMGHDTHIESKNATCVVLPTTQPINPAKNEGELMRVTNQEQPFHPLYKYAYITDAEEGLISFDFQTLTDGEPRNNFLDRALTWNPGGLLNGVRHLTIAGYWFYFATDRGVVVVNMDDPLNPVHVTTIDLPGVRGTAVQFRYLYAATRDGFQVVDITKPEQPVVLPDAMVRLSGANRIHVARTYAYVAAGSEGVAIIDVTRPDNPELFMKFNGGGAINDVRDVTVATTNASLFAYVADGRNGLRIVQLTSPELQPNFYGFSPEPNPRLVATYPTDDPALALSRALERDRAVDETGNQIAVFGRIGSRPFNLEEMQQLYLDDDGNPWFVTDDIGLADELDRQGEVTLYGIQFDTDSARLRPESEPVLNQVLEALEQRPDFHIAIEGHTDATASDAYNMTLSQRRAAAIVDWLVDRGIARERLEASGKGESEPIADNRTAEGRQQNRRVEIRVL